MKLLVIGGAGYIGSHFIREALELGHECLIYDNLSTGHKKSIPSEVKLVEKDILDKEAIKKTLNSYKPDAILHYAALALVGESVKNPNLYYTNNVLGVKALVDAMVETKLLKPLIFSSTCAVFGSPEKLPISEDDRKVPISPYARSKLMAEFIIEDYARTYGFKSVALRYFNACGAHASGQIGESHDPESHITPNIIRSVLKKESFSLFGNDFSTKDGTCVRDYIHVKDLAISHILATEYLTKPDTPFFTAIHLGTGNGYSNLEIVKAIEKATNKEIKCEISDRRPGDPAALYADNKRAKELLNFEPKCSNLQNIIESALNWHKNNPQGFKE